MNCARCHANVFHRPDICSQLISDSMQLLASSWGGHVAGVNQCRLPKIMNSVIHLSTASNAKVCLCTHTHTPILSSAAKANVCLCAQTP